MRRGGVIGMSIRCSVLIVLMHIGHVSVVGHCLMVMIMLAGSRHRRAQGHRCGSEAVERHRQQRDPDDQDFQDGFHAAILAYARVFESPLRSPFMLRSSIVRTCHFCMC